MQNHNFPQSYEDYRSRITRYLAGLAGEDVAADLSQEVFVKVARGLKDFCEEANLSSWIYRIATNTYYDHVRGRAFRQQQKEQLIPTESIDVSEDETRGIGEKTPIAE